MSKQKIELIAETTTYENLSAFESVSDLNEAIRHYKRLFADELNKTELAVLDLLAQHSCKYPGVSFLRKTKLGELIGKSRRTMIRVCKRLETLGIIRQYEMKRNSDMQQTANAIVIQAPVTQAPTESVTQKNSDSPKLENIKDINTYPPEKSVDLQPRKVSTPYSQFRDRVNNFVKNRKLTNRLYGIYLAQTKHLRVAYEPTELLTEGIEAIKVTFQATKRKAIKNLYGYYSGTLRKLLDGLYEATMAELCNDNEMTNDKVPAWLYGW
ncbi:helix-turn-helix domain-containing protein [Peribacillus asahii]|uniref:helix-turn-helix domain-containing protein n=1 Tax=Peribacillus asahii TaxID=228899 RepID=UPI00207AF7C9|nr:helix-turn-helix domain-containing protein [Peribacillus asahii]USK59191.1 helix-turn-helix domain-containing protein [Peribacillus asahii]